jgi:membrane protein DedA with SNARE-associated domain
MSLQEIADAVVTFVQANQAWAAPVAFALAFGESLAFISLILPSTVILVAIGGLLGASSIDIWPVVIAAGLGGSLGYAISYWIGLYFNDSINAYWPFRDYPEMMRRGRAFFEKYGAFAVFLGHFFGPIRAVIPVIAGMAAMRQIPFQIANVTSAFLWAGGVIAPSFFGVAWLAGH